MHDGQTRKVDATEAGKSLDFLENHRVSLTMVTGTAAGTEFSLESGRSVAGRSDTAEIKLDDRSVSSEHAVFEVDANGFGVRDLASTNGVRVNGKPVLSTTLAHGDRIMLGDCELQYIVEERKRPPTAWSLEEDA